MNTSEREAVYTRTAVYMDQPMIAMEITLNMCPVILEIEDPDIVREIKTKPAARGILRSSMPME